MVLPGSGDRTRDEDEDEELICVREQDEKKKKQQQEAYDDEMQLLTPILLESMYGDGENRDAYLFTPTVVDKFLDDLSPPPPPKRTREEVVFTATESSSFPSLPYLNTPLQSTNEDSEQEDDTADKTASTASYTTFVPYSEGTDAVLFVDGHILHVDKGYSPSSPRRACNVVPVLPPSPQRKNTLFSSLADSMASTSEDYYERGAEERKDDEDYGRYLSKSASTTSSAYMNEYDFDGVRFVDRENWETYWNHEGYYLPGQYGDEHPYKGHDEAFIFEDEQFHRDEYVAPVHPYMTPSMISPSYEEFLEVQKADEKSGNSSFDEIYNFFQSIFDCSQQGPLLENPQDQRQNSFQWGFSFDAAKGGQVVAA